MESFCHQLSKPAGRVHAKREDQYVNLVVVLKVQGQQCLSAEVDTRRHPKVCDLLRPVCGGKLTAFLQGPAGLLTLQANGEDLIRDVRMHPVAPIEALQEVLDASCQQSASLAGVLAKQKSSKSLSTEACDLLMRIEKQRKEDFAKFILLLNEKKRKIRELQSELGLEVSEDVAEDDFGLSAEVTKMSQESPEEMDKPERLESAGPSKVALRLKHRRDDEGKEGDEVTVDADVAGASDDVKPGDRRGRHDMTAENDDEDEDVVDSDEVQSDRGHSDDNEAVIDDEDIEMQRDDGGTPDMASPQAPDDSMLRSGMRKTRRRKIADDDDDDASSQDDDYGGEGSSLKEKMAASQSLARGAKSVKKGTTSLDMLDDLL